MIVTETSRLLLRYFSWDDLNDMAAIYADPVVMTFRGGPRNYENTKQHFKWIFENYKKPGFELWAIVDKADNKFIGNCGVIPQEVDGQPENEMGYILAKEYWGRGLATEAACAVRDYGFNKLGYSRLVALIDSGNIASQRVAMKAGLTYEKNTSMWGKTVRVYAIHNHKLPQPRHSSYCFR
ncbi:MAG: GNAT family N-acetyltransferase [Coleofasciculus sp. S288]|nr:GNAT family N-acetyltransferase [Coleofasciculus sp. S288]